MTQDARPRPPAETAPAAGGGWLLAMTSLAAVLMTLDITVVNVALPEVAADLDAGLTGLQWVVNAYTLVFAALLLPAGSLSDRIGRRRLFLTGVAVFTAASAGCGAAPGVGTLIACRALQGLGGALVMSTALALIAGAYEGRRRQSAIGMFSAAGGAAAALGPLVGAPSSRASTGGGSSTSTCRSASSSCSAPSCACPATTARAGSRAPRGGSTWSGCCWPPGRCSASTTAW
ncbi:MFS transporter [Streptomyces sp. ST1015]|nr:MFS transporter [Streptomyces sp. ST1015]